MWRFCVADFQMTTLTRRRSLISLAENYLIYEFLMVASFLRRTFEHSISLKGVQLMVVKRSYFAGSMVVCTLTFTVSIGSALAQGQWTRDAIEKQIRTEKSDLQRDEEQLAADVSYLRKSLRQRKSQELITQLRYQVRQDWQQIVLDRGHSDSEREDQTSNLVNRRHKRNAQSG
jgi:hypothetical protein